MVEPLVSYSYSESTVPVVVTMKDFLRFKVVTS
jgi:hypothetical protein